MLRVLVVDDDRFIPEMVCRALRRRGVEATAASSFDEALSRLTSERWTYLLTDVRMPGGGGLELAARARALDAALKVVVMSGSTRAELGLAADVELLHKPFEVADVLSCLGVAPLAAR
ncbi:MAG: response regulator [Myxococcaceae bacterium]|jgi:CheY-like chemotaxis protein|nr:response regulator [Myxococcaceae bacterium]